MNTRPLRRSESITIKVEPQEKEMIYAAAAAAGVTVTAFLIGCSIGDALGDKLIEQFDKPKFKGNK